MTISDDMIDSAIRKCQYRNKGMIGKDRSITRYAICNLEISTCNHVIESGKCSALIELFAKEGVEHDSRRTETSGNGMD